MEMTKQDFMAQRNALVIANAVVNEDEQAFILAIEDVDFCTIMALSSLAGVALVAMAEQSGMPVNEMAQQMFLRFAQAIEEAPE